MLTKLGRKQIVAKLKNSNYDKTLNIKLWQNSKTQIVTVVIMTLVTEAVVTLAKVTLVLTWHLESRWDVLGAAVRKSCNVILLSLF